MTQQITAVSNEKPSEEDSDIDIPCAQRSPKQQRQSWHYNIMDENGLDWTTVIHNNKGNRRKSSSGSDGIQATAVSKNGNQPSLSFQDSQSTQQKLKSTYSQMVKNPGCSKDISSQQPRRNNRDKTSLKGVKQERSIALYLKSIQVSEESNEEIGKMVRDYASNKGIRVMGYQIIRYKTCNDAVGCKIFVPEAQQTKALNPDVWPQDITCRRWERPDLWQEKMRREQKRQYEERMREEERRNIRSMHEDSRDRYDYYSRDY